MKYVFLGIISASVMATSSYGQDIAAGQKIYTQCSACHQVGETARNTVGPVLNGIVGKPAASVEGYNYSAKMKESGITWTEEELAAFIENPRKKIPGTKMTYPGLKDPAKIADLLAYLKQFDGSGKRVP